VSQRGKSGILLIRKRVQVGQHLAILWPRPFTAEAIAPSVSLSWRDQSTTTTRELLEGRVVSRYVFVLQYRAWFQRLRRGIGRRQIDDLAPNTVGDAMSTSTLDE